MHTFQLGCVEPEKGGVGETDFALGGLAPAEIGLRDKEGSLPHSLHYRVVLRPAIVEYSNRTVGNRYFTKYSFGRW